MLNNTTHGDHMTSEVGKTSGVRKLVKRNNKQDSNEPSIATKPKVSRLGQKTTVRRLGGTQRETDKTAGSDSERSDKSSSTNKSVANDWNAKRNESVEKWEVEEDSWENFALEPECIKKKMYKCGPVTDKDEKVFPRLQAPTDFALPKDSEAKRFKNPEMNFLQQEIIQQTKISNLDREKPQMSFLDSERDQNIKQKSPSAPPPQSSWLRTSWLANVSKSVASLTAQVSSNISAALDTETSPETNDLKQLIGERLKDHQVSNEGFSSISNEESPRKGRKYLHKIGIDDDIRPIYAFQEKKNENYSRVEVPSTETKVQKEQKQPNPELVVKQVTKLEDNMVGRKISSKDHAKKEIQEEKQWDDEWSNNDSESIVPPKINKSNVQSVKKVRKLDSKMASKAFLEKEILEVPIKKNVSSTKETMNRMDKTENSNNFSELRLLESQSNEEQVEILVDSRINNCELNETSKAVESIDQVNYEQKLPESVKESSIDSRTTCSEEIIELLETKLQENSTKTNEIQLDDDKKEKLEQEIVPDSWDAWQDEEIVFEETNCVPDESAIEIPKVAISDMPETQIPNLLSTETFSMNTENVQKEYDEVKSQDIQTKNIPTVLNDSESPPEIEIEPIVVKKDMYKCGSEEEDDEKSEIDKKESTKLDLPLQIAVNEEHEWNDWDQEMIIEVSATGEEPIRTLETPITEMHISSSVKSSALHSPPFTINNERVRGARGSICEYEEYLPNLGNFTKAEMEAKIKASLNIEMNKFYEQNSDNEWNESESEMVFDEENSEREPVRNEKLELIENTEIESTNNLIVEEQQIKASNLQTEMKHDLISDPNAEFETKNVKSEESDGVNFEVEPEQRENEGDTDFSPTTSLEYNNQPETPSNTVDIEPIQVLVEEIVEYTTESSQCFSIPVSSIIPSQSQILTKSSSVENLQNKINEDKPDSDDSVPNVKKLPMDELKSIPLIEVEPEVIKKNMYKCGSEEEHSSGFEFNQENLNEAVSQRLLQPVESSWGEDDWGSNVSERGSTQITDESDEEIENELVNTDSSHPDVRVQTKQKTVEECIQLLKQNRQELTKKIEDKRKENEKEVTQENLHEYEEEPILQSKNILGVQSVKSTYQELEDLHTNIQHNSQNPQNPDNVHEPQETSNISWEEDEDNLNLVVSKPTSPVHLPFVQLSVKNSNPPEIRDENQKNLFEEQIQTESSALSDDKWDEDWSEDILDEKQSKDQQEDQSFKNDNEAQIEVEPLILKRNMYKCGSEEELRDPVETFESRKVEGSENKRPEPIGASFEKDEVLTPLEQVINTEEKEQSAEVNKDKDAINIQNEEDWNDNWDLDADVKLELPAMKTDSEEKEPIDFSAEAETSNDNDWDDFDAWGEEDDVVEPEIHIQPREIPESHSEFKVPAIPKVQNINMESKPIENVFSKLENKNQWNWKSNWGVSLLANASKNVATITAQVSQNLSSALDTGIIPQPEEMAKIVKKDEDITRQRTSSVSSQKSRQSKESSVEPENKQETPMSSEETGCSRKSSVESLPESESNFKEKLRRPTSFIPLTNIVSGVTQMSSKVITGGLDTLEGIGKKTFTMIQENVHDVDRKGLSDILNEAKIENSPVEVKVKEKLPQFEIMFDDHGGLVHLEALEILSKQASIKIEMLLSKLAGDELKKMQETLKEVEELSSLSDLSENEEGEGNGAQLEDRLLFAVRDLDVELTFSEISECLRNINKYLSRNGSKAHAKDLYEKALDSLAEFTSLGVARYHKLAELLSVSEYHSTANEADALVSLTTTLFWQINNIATRFNKIFNTMENSDENTKFITNIFLEASHAKSYIQQAFTLFTPILKIGAT
uniref:CSON006332 protein n=1 Tax=Culicoides sonorensis TaxID=179676 RepID=A0A336M847_CULSO